VNLDITLDSEAEQVVIILDDQQILKANKGLQSAELKYNEAFRTLQDDDEPLFKLLRRLSVDLLLLD